MNDFFISYIAYRNKRSVGIGGLVVVCSCGLGRIRTAILELHNNDRCKIEEYKADNIIITSLTVLDPLTAVQLTDNFSNNVLRIEEDCNSAEEQQI